MNKITECIKRNKKLSIEIIAVITLIILIAVALSVGNIDIGGKSAKTISSDTAVITEHMTLGQSEFNREFIEKVTSYINSGNNGVYTIEDRHFVILTTGGESATDIEYKAESTTDGKLNIYYKLSDTPDGDSRIRYKIIEVTSPDIEIIKEKSTNTEELTGTGFKQLLIFKYNNEKQIYSIEDKKLISGNTWDTDGAYIGTFKDGELTECSSIDSVIIEGCNIKEKVTQSDKLYIVELPSKDIIQVYIDDSNLDLESNITLKIRYNSTLPGFSGEAMEGYYIEKR